MEGAIDLSTPLPGTDPATRADRLLRDVLGEAQYFRMKAVGYLDLPSGKVAGRIYRLDSGGNLSYRDPGETAFNTSLCVQPLEDVPRDDQTAMRYLLVTADEERLLQTANPITFGLLSLIRALHHDFTQHHSPLASLALALSIVGFFLGSLAVEIWAVVFLLAQHALAATALLVVFLVPAFIGGVLIAAGIAEGARAVSRTVRQLRMARTG